MKNADFKDESFISQFLSPTVMREFRLFAVEDDDSQDKLQISAIHNDDGYRQLRQKLAAQYNLSQHEPNIQIYNVAIRGDRSLTLRYTPHERIPLAASHKEVLRHLHKLWGFGVVLEQEEYNGKISTLARCPEPVTP